MDTTKLTLHSRFAVSDVDPRLFGGFLEHMGRAVYQGVFEPGNPRADADGYRADVLAALEPLRFTAMRWPGGNFASGYHWIDGTGPRARRPVTRDLAWQSIEPNTFGTEEYLRLCRRMGWRPMVTVNLGTGTPEEARNWVEYCNCPAGTRWADLRAEAGAAAPHGVKLWCLGNEMDGPWQIGHVPADQYAIRAQQAAKLMKDTDRSIELVACGTCMPELPTYMEWDRVVLEHLGDLADYVSLHRYAGDKTGDTEDYLAVSAAVDRQIEDMDAACRWVQARRRSAKRARLCFDEWNVWYKNMEMDGRGTHAPPLVEEVYDLQDALVVAGFLNSFLRHADVVRIANLAQVVNVIAPVLARESGVLLQSTWHVLAMYAARRAGVSLHVRSEGPRCTGRSNGSVPLVDSAAVIDGSTLKLFLVNRSPAHAAPVTVDLADGTIVAARDAEVLHGSDPHAANSWERPDLLAAGPYAGWRVRDGRADAELPPLSVSATTFSLG